MGEGSCERLCVSVCLREGGREGGVGRECMSVCVFTTGRGGIACVRVPYFYFYFTLIY